MLLSTILVISINLSFQVISSLFFFPHYYSLDLVLFSYAVSVFGAYVSLRLFDYALEENDRRTRMLWLLLAATVLGGGAIWAMHFIAMLAFDMGMEVNYDLFLTLFSMLLAIVVSSIGLLAIGLRKSNWLGLLFAGTFLGIGFAGMHYTGMAAMMMEASLSYIPALFWLSIAFSICSSIAALWLFLNARKVWQRWASAVIMGAAISGIHYIGMSAAVFTPLTVHAAQALGAGSIVQNADFILFISVAVIFTLIMVIFISLQEAKEK